MKAHYLATYLPELGMAELKELAADIKENGQKEAIVTIKDEVSGETVILDGRNRFAACMIAKVKPKLRKFGSEKSDGKDPRAFVISQNIHRRHLNDTQRALAAGEMAAQSAPGRPKGQEEAKDATGGNGEAAAAPTVATQAEAAEIFDVPQPTVKKAAKVAKSGSKELKKAVQSGEVSLSKAASVAKLPKEKQLKAAKSKPAKKESKQSPKEKLLVALDQLWIDNRDKWNEAPMCQPAAMVRHFQKLIEKVL